VLKSKLEETLIKIFVVRPRDHVIKLEKTKKHPSLVCVSHKIEISIVLLNIIAKSFKQAQTNKLKRLSQPLGELNHSSILELFLIPQLP